MTAGCGTRHEFVTPQAKGSTLQSNHSQNPEIDLRPRDSSGSVADIQEVDFHFDIMCPWAYQGSLWIREVRDQLGLKVNWRFFSLEEINRQEGKKHPWEREWSYGWSMMRVGARLAREDPALVDRWYSEAGTALHVDGRKPHRREVAEELVERLGLPRSVVTEAIEDQSTHDDVLSDHQRVVDLGGWGVPTLVFDESNALFGPVLVDPPTADAAVRLWHHMCGLLEFGSLYEIQRPKRKADLIAIAETFKPYVEARDWVTIQNETP